MKYCFGVDLGGTTVKMGLFQMDGELVEKWEIPTRTQNGGEAIIPDIAMSIQNKISERGLEKTEIVGIGMGVPAAVKEDGIVKRTSNLGWEYKEVKRELEELSSLPVKVGNDANVAALGEMWQGGGKGYKDLIMVTLGTGVGGGIIIDGRILVGVSGAGAEIGHLTVNPHETESCGCGRCGCLEQYASATGMVRLAKQRLRDNTKETVLNAESVTAKDVFDAVKASDEVAMEIAEEFASYLGHALAELSVVVDPSVIVIGGGVSKAGEILITYVDKYFKERALWENKKIQLVLATLGNDAGIYGAAKLVLDL